ncbi:MAG: bifunctional acetate--CoA ligase family protein/GNAT family N-acetyltransferase [Gammaproteobacteria bacterium]|nr:bifunctional acetate--CoA ligase family protein/GNAT family N-acetyltransferase [Gammaproteobacteria bacterium]
MPKHFLNSLFTPKSLALFGASERADTVGQVVMQNMLESGFQGSFLAINPKHSTILGQAAYASLKEVEEPVDLAVITTPAQAVPGIMEDCGEHGVRAAIIISAGFREVGPSGAKLEQRVSSIAKHYGIRFLGPNCLGLMTPAIGLNATFNKGGAQAGGLALISQSGALCTAIIDWAGLNDIGFSAVVSTGISADLDFGDILDYLTGDPHTHSIIMYIEGIRRSRAFMSALRAAARMKPVIVLKVGRHEAGSKAAVSHTGALVGGDDAFDAALQRAGVVRVATFGQLFATAKTLASRYRAYGSRLAIITNGGGPGVMAADRIADLPVKLAELDSETVTALNAKLPPTWSRNNPIDIIGDADADRYHEALAIVLRDKGVDGVLVLLTPQAMTHPVAVAEKTVALALKSTKPVLTCWMGQKEVAAGRDLFAQQHIPDFRTPEAAVEAFAYLAMHHRNQKLLVQTPASLDAAGEPDVEGAQIIIESVLAEHRKVLSEMESKALLRAFNIPIVGTAVAKTANEALVLAESMGLPVAMKINSAQITHKSDVGGVRLNLNNAHAIRTAFKEIISDAGRHRPDAELAGVTVERMSNKVNGRELFIGVTRDPVFGPIITFGNGGSNIEVIDDKASALPPLNRFLARNLINDTKIKKMLREFRGMPAIDMNALESVLLRVSDMVCELPWLQEMDINPLIADESGAVAVDARIVVDYYTPSSDRYAHMAVCPYPNHLTCHWQLADGTDITIRSIRPEDADIEKAFIKNLSDRAKYFRFMQSLKELTPEMLIRFTQIDYDREMAFIAVSRIDGRDLELGVARYAMNPDALSCEFAIVVADEWQERGLAHKLMASLMDAARNRGLKTMYGEVLSNNVDMLNLIKNLGFSARVDEDDHSITKVVKPLNS